MALFGYLADGNWVLIGERQDQYLPLEDPARVGEDRAHMAAKYGTQPWDAAWLAAVFDLHMRPLPEGWRTSTDPAGSEGIAAALNEFIQP